MIKFEKPYWNANRLVLGVDEAGRGPMAGPLVVVGVVLPIYFRNELINDSKQLNASNRRKAFDLIIENAIEINVEIVNELTIDRYNIYQATKKAMELISQRSEADYVLVDAMVLNTNKNSKSIIKGDAKSISIAAASIVAKEIRDAIMIYYDAIYPEYGFKNHKGYPTKKHKEMLEKYGVLPIHRKSYRPVFEALQPQFKL